MKFPRCVLERISMKYDRNLGAFGTKERNEIWAEVGRNSGLRQPTERERERTLRRIPSAIHRFAECQVGDHTHRALDTRYILTRYKR